jgi:hypothetical protein
MKKQMYNNNDFMCLKIVCDKLLEAAKNQVNLQEHLLSLADVMGGIKAVKRYKANLESK